MQELHEAIRIMNRRTPHPPTAVRHIVKHMATLLHFNRHSDINRCRW
jgi:hypothetical protein